MTTTPPVDPSVAAPVVPPHPGAMLAWLVPWALLVVLSVVTLVQHPPSQAETWRGAGAFVVIGLAAVAAIVVQIVRVVRTVPVRRAFVATWSPEQRAEFTRARLAGEPSTPPLVAGAIAATLALAGATLIVVFFAHLAPRPGGLSSALAVVLIFGMVAFALLGAGIRRWRARRPT